MASHQTNSPKSTITARIAQVLKSRKYRRENRSVIAVLALAVVLGVAIVLMQRGLAKKYTVRVLDCHYVGNVAHTHNQDCYDDAGNLICPLRERELHTHTEECFDEEGNLICGKDELVEEHVHGDGCFKTIMTDTPPASESDFETTATAKGEVAEGVEESNPTPAQHFTHEFNDNDGNTVMIVDVESPDGALPKDATMEVTWIDPLQVNRDKVQKAVSATTAGKVLDVQAVDITFYNAAHEEVEPESDVKVTFTTDLLNSPEQAQVIHVESEEEAAERDKDAEPEAECVPTLAGKSLGDDQLAFKSSDFSQYVIALVSSSVSVTATSDLPEGSTITIDASADAGLPQTMGIDAVQYGADQREYETLVNAALDAVELEKTSYAKAFDIRLMSGEDEIQPQAPVLASISLSDLPKGGSFVVAHYDTAAQTAEIVNSWAEGDSIVFEAESFSPYVVIEVDQDAAPAPDAGTGTLHVMTTITATADEEDLQDCIDAIQFALHGTGTGTDGTDFDRELPLEVEEGSTKITTIDNLPAGSYTAALNLQDTDEYNISVTFEPSNGTVSIPAGDSAVLRVNLTVGRKPAEHVVGDIVDLKIDKRWQTVGGQEMSWPPDAEPLVLLRRMKSTNEGRTWSYDSNYEETVYLNHSSTSTMLYGLDVQDPDVPGLLYKYYIIETQIPNGYSSTTKIGTNEIATYDWNDPVPESDLQDAAVNTNVTISLVNTLVGSGDNIDLTVHKEWVDRSGAATTPPAGTQATFTLHRVKSTDGGLTYTEDTDFTGTTKTIGTTDETFTNLPYMSDDGELYKYYAKETTIPNGWEPVYVGKNGSDATISSLVDSVATDQSRTQVVKNRKIPTVDVPVIKQWPDFDPAVHAGATWEAGFVLDRSEVDPATQNQSDFAVLDPNDIQTLTNDTELVFHDLPKYRVDENGNQYHFVYSVTEMSYHAQRPQNGDDPARTVDWTGPSTTGKDYYTVFIQDAGDPQIPIYDNDERWYQIRLSNIENSLEAPTATTEISVSKTWNTNKTPSSAEFELVRFAQQSYRDWTTADDTSYNDKTTWKPAQLTFGGNTSTTIDMPDGAAVYVVATFKDGPAGNGDLKVSYTDLNGDTQTVTLHRMAGPGNEGKEVWSAPIYPKTNSSGIREITVTDGGDRAQSVRLSDIQPAQNQPVQDGVASVLEMNAPVWTGQFVNDMDSTKPMEFPLEQSEPMVDRVQTVYNYSYYVRETAATPRSTATMEVAGATHDRDHRIDINSGSNVTVDVTNRDMAQFAVVKDWADVINPDKRYPAVFFTLYQKKKGTDRGQVYVNPEYDQNYFKDIELSSANNFRWECPFELPRYNANGEEVEYYVVEKTKDADSNNNGAGTKTYTEPAFSDAYTPEVKLYYAYSGFANQTTYANYINSNNPGQPWNASVHATEMPGSNGVVAIGGEIAIRNNPPKSDQMDMLKKKWFDWKENGGGAAPSLDAGEHMNLSDCIVEYIVVRRALDESHPEYNTAKADANYTGDALVKGWDQWYHRMYQGFDDQGNAYSTDVSEDFAEWRHSSQWLWNLNKNNQYGGGLEYRGYELVNGVPKAVTYQYVFIETGLWRWREAQNPISGEMEPVFDTPFREDYEYYAILPDAWSADGQIPLFSRIVAQDQDRITNLVGSNLLIQKAWGASEDLRDLEEVYLKVYYQNYHPVNGPQGNAVDFTNIAATDANTVVGNQGVIDQSRYEKIGNEYYLRLSKGEASLLLSRVPMGLNQETFYRYWVEEKGWKGTDGQVHMNVDRFSPTYAVWDSATGAWGPDSSVAKDAGLILGKKDENRIMVDNTPTKKVKVLKRWQDENGNDTQAWKNEVQYTIERQARRYSNVGTTDEPRFIQDMWFTNDGGQTWLTREEFNALADQSGYEAAGYGAYVNGTFTPSAWEKLTFKVNGGAASNKLQVSNSPVLYNVKADGAGTASYTATTGTPDQGDAPTYTDASGNDHTATNWYAVIDGLADSITEDADGDGKVDYEYRYTYRVTEATAPDDGCCVTYEPSSGSLAAGQATIINAKNSLRVVKRWFDSDNVELTEPWDSSLKVKFKVEAVAQKWVFNPVTNLWKEDGDPSAPVEITGTDKLEIKQANQIVVATLDSSDATHTTYTFAASDAPSGTKINNREKWAMRIDGLETEFKDPNDDYKKTTFTYHVIEEPINGAITTYSPHVSGDDAVGRVTNGHAVEIRNRKNPVEIEAQKVFTGLKETDIFETDQTDPSVKHVKAPLSNIRLKLENTSQLPIGVTSGVVFDDTLGALYDGGLITYEVDANDPTKITFKVNVKPGATYPNYSGTLHLDAIVSSADYKLTETNADTNVPGGYQYSASGRVTEDTGNAATDSTDGKLTLQVANPYKKVIITAKKEFTGIDIADFIETDANSVEHVKAPLKDISLKLVNTTDSTIVLEDTIGNLFDGGVLTYAYDASSKKLTLSMELSTDANFTNYSGTIHKEYLLGGKTYELTESDADTKVPVGYQFRAADADSADDGTPEASGANEGKLTLTLANPYDEIKIHVEKQFVGLNDIFSGVTNDKIKTDYDNLGAGVKKILEGVKLSLKNNGTLPSGVDPYVFQNKSLKELIQGDVLTFDGTSFKVAGDITKASPLINVNALVGGCEYELTESGADLAASIPDGFVYVAGESTASAKATLDASTADLSVALKNTYIPTIDIVIYKVEANDQGEPITTGSPLAGATFTLEKGTFEEGATAGTTVWSKDNGFTSNVTETSDGVFEQTGLEAGFYKIIEGDVPAGHIKLDYDPIIEISYDAQQHKLVVAEVATDQATGKDISKGIEVSVNGTDTRIYVANPPGEELPHSGGPGTLPMTLAGIALLASASLYLLKAHLKEGLNLHKLG